MADAFQPMTFSVGSTEWVQRLVVAPPEEPGLEEEEEEAQLEYVTAARAAEARRAREHGAALAAVAERERSLAETEQRLSDIALKLEEDRTALFREARAGLADLILAAARRIAGDALRADPALLDALVDEGVRALGDEGLVLRVSEADFDRVQERLGFRSVLVVADPELDGGCTCEGPAGRIDASKATAEAAIATVLAQWAER